jgi:putative transposase
MKELRLDYPLALVRRVLSVSASGYYSWLDRPLSKWAREETRLEVEIKAAYKRTRQTYGSERLQYDLAEHGIRVGICRIKRIRRKLGICCKQKRKFKATTDSKHIFPEPQICRDSSLRFLNRIRCGQATSPNVPTDEGWLYVAGHKDLFTGNIRWIRHGRTDDREPRERFFVPGN